MEIFTTGSYIIYLPQNNFFLLFQEHFFLTFFQLDADNFEKEGKLAEIQAQRGYTYSDCITCTPEKLPNYEQKVLSVCNEVTFLT